MDHDIVPSSPEMQPHGAPGPGSSFSHSQSPGRPVHPSRLPGGMPPLIPVLRKTVHLDAFPQSHIQTSSRPALKARTRNASTPDAGIAPGAPLSPLTANSLTPRKLSSISLTIRQNSQLRPVDMPLSPWEDLPTLGREAATHKGGRPSAPGSPPLAPGQEGKVHPEGPGDLGLAKLSRTLPAEKPLVSSYLTLPFQSRRTPSSPGLARPSPVGQGYSRASPGRGKYRARGLSRPRNYLQRASPVTNLAAADTARPVIPRHFATMATNRPRLVVSLATSNTPGLDTDTELQALDTKLGTAKSGKATNLATTSTNEPGVATIMARVGTIKPRKVVDSITTDPEKLGKVTATGDTASIDRTTGDFTKPERTPRGTIASALETAADPVKRGSVSSDTAVTLARANTAEMGPTVDCSALGVNRLAASMGSVVLVTPDTIAGDSNLDSDDNLTLSDLATYSLMPSRSVDTAQDQATVVAATDRDAEVGILDVARERKGKGKNLSGVFQAAGGAREPGDGACLD
ncbi:uncharacterized protein ACOB6Z_001514 [Ctenodactylus gundi]